MKCPVCENSGQRSTVRMTPSAPPTQIPKEHFWDEDGNEHHHNPNHIRTRFLCSNGHRFEEVSSWQCCVEGCGYKACDAKLFVIGAQATETTP